MNETVLQELEAYAAACDVCASLLIQSPTDESLTQLASLKDLLTEEPFSSISADAAAQMAQVLGEYQANPEEVLAELRQDYTFLFYMVSLSKSSPFESVYVSEDRTMCGPALLAVREVYRQWGVKLPEGASSLEDHMGYELSFVAHLLGIAMDHLEQGESYDKELEALAAFVKEHINAYADEYFDHSKKAARTDFYKGVMTLSHDLVRKLVVRFA